MVWLVGLKWLSLISYVPDSILSLGVIGCVGLLLSPLAFKSFVNF